MLSTDGVVRTVIKFEHACVADYEEFFRLYRDYPRTSLEVEALAQSFMVLFDDGRK